MDYYKAGRVLAIDETDQTWEEVRIDFASPDGKIDAVIIKLE
ncbi:hypothetical protein H1P_2940011 [Hyella patelloides LEGE 07179]|uniref:Uncharacterized protein n=1 Tax=Hyella patelloides LEGE 07179 TaxID=945734 RepID=A0A563VTV5_9CYAN|nr:hypothetical protein [Hyella patelloides]VEP14880.1 hypothetical protein H1P_2940011 [Hyella patelloides LEGE 07179]